MPGAGWIQNLQQSSTIPWYDSNWPYRVRLTTDGNEIPGAISAFPTPLIKTIAGLTKAQADADDILFTLSDGTTKIPHHIEHFNGATGEIVAKIKMDHAGAVSDTIYMYYGNATAGNQQDTINTYDANFKLALTLNEDPTAAAPQFLDLTSNNNDGTSQNMEAGDSVAGKIRNAVDLDGVNEYISMPHSASLDIVGDVTCEYWVNFDVVNVDQIVIDKTKTPGSDPSPYTCYINDSGGTRYHAFYHHQQGGDYNSALTFTSAAAQASVWEHVAFVRNISTKTVTLFINGQQVQQLTWGTDDPQASGDLLEIGRDTTGGRHVNGQLDDLRISDVQRSPNWLAATYNTVQNAATFWTVGAEESFAINFDAEVGTYALSGAASTLFIGAAMDAAVYTVSGVNAESLANYLESLNPSAYSLTGSDAELITSHLLHSELGTYLTSGVNADLLLSALESLDTGSYSLTGLVADLAGGLVFDAETGIYTVGGISADLTAVYLEILSAGVYGLTGINADLSGGLIFDAETGLYTISGINAELAAAYRETLVSGNYALTGINADLSGGLVFDAETGLYAITGLDADVLVSYLESLNAGNYGLTGIDAALLQAFLIESSPGVYGLSGINAELISHYLETLNAGDYSLTGIDAELVTVGVLTLDANTGVYTLIGIDANLLGQYFTDAEASSYSVSGVDSFFLNRYDFFAELSAYATTGAATELLAHRLESLTAGAYSLSGVDAGLPVAFQFDAESGLYVATGIDASVLAQYAVDLSIGSYTHSGVDATLIYSELIIPTLIRLGAFQLKTPGLGTITVT